VSPLDRNMKLKIIIVDDNQPDHFFIKSALSDFKNITFQSFYNGEDFIKYLLDQDNIPDESSDLPDIVILDINMPRLNGFEVFEATKKCKRHTGIYFTVLSTSITPVDKAKCEEFNLVCNIKPFSIEKFRVILESIIGEYTLRH
jgi:two-component system, chemotaxis family, response regulator Rcp1